MKKHKRLHITIYKTLFFFVPFFFPCAVAFLWEVVFVLHLPLLLALDFPLPLVVFCVHPVDVDSSLRCLTLQEWNNVQCPIFFAIQVAFQSSSCSHKFLAYSYSLNWRRQNNAYARRFSPSSQQSSTKSHNTLNERKENYNS